ncbi:MAG: hypothetical protein Q9225_000730 [Loekoesia sp. 1 TL-2023]
MVKPDGATEQERLGKVFPSFSTKSLTESDLQHQVWLLSLNGRLYNAPLGNDAGFVLDIGCGTGAWALAIANKFPSSKIIATDLTPPKITPPRNLQIVESDADKQWTFNERFGFIHGRMLTSGIHDWPTLLSQCWEYLEPGGWLELLDVCHPFRAQDHAYDNESSNFIKWGHVAEKCWEMRGLDYRATTKHQERLRKLGFISIREEELIWPLGEWSDSAQERLIGKLTLDNFSTFLATAGVGIITQDPRISTQEAEKLVADAKQDLMDNCHTKRFYLTM